ncbi:MAG: homogentisate 1,2-dioxygenase [Labilithrix sp.]|nr:homogentisate 1,2-dioxygenase [Labilithrix sp.]MCW5814251.1 homogentisate 1,2-dioxygenase [Labilithrix sp.]
MQQGTRFSVRRGAAKVVFGAGVSLDPRAELEALGAKKVLVVCTPGRAADAAALAKNLGALGATVYAKAREHVPRATVDDAHAAAEGADVLLALGGGSAIGLAKALALRGAARVVAIPTTYSGSEMTPVYGITEDGAKKTGRDERVRPVLVLYDPDRLASLPRPVAVASLWNAAAHAVEALWNDPSDRGTHALAEEALTLIVRALRGATSTSGTIGASGTIGEEALEGAYLAGLAFADAGAGIHHKLCHELGGAFGLPHARTHAVLLPHVVRYQRERAPAAMAALARVLGVVDPAAELTRLARATGAPTSLEELGLPRGAMEDPIVEAAWPKTPSPIKETSLRGPEDVRGRGGYGGAHESEALPGAIPETQNAPRLSPYGLVPELVNGMPFTVRNVENSRVWLYRVRASFDHGELVELPPGPFLSPLDRVEPNRTRWRPPPIPSAPARVDFVDGLATLGGAGDPTSGSGYLVHLYAANADMTDRAFSSADGDLLLAPQTGTLECRTELGWLRVPPGSIAVIPRGIRFAIGFAEGEGRGWMLEVFGRRLRLPERGLIGSNGLADARHFYAPVASYEDRACDFQIVTKLGGRLYAATQKHSAFDVVGWHGTHVPFSYDLSLFSPMGSVRFDHQDPSIFTVLTAPLDDHGRAICDFVVFPPRWDVLEHSFRPPFAHRNAASEINCVVKTPEPEHGYEPGVTFLSPLLTSHGVTTETYDETWSLAEADAEGPRRLSDDSVWIMFESALPFRLTEWARRTELVDRDFGKLFEGMRSRFDPAKR